MAQLPNDVNYSASGGSSEGATDLNARQMWQQLVRELGAIRALLGCSTPTTGANAFVIGAGAGPLTGIKSAFDMPSCASGGRQSTTLTVTGAALGDFVEVSCSIDLAGLVLSAYVNAADTVTIQVTNNTGGAVDLAAADYRVCVFPKASANAASVPVAMKLTL